MFPKLARMTDSVWCLITMNQLIIPKDVDGGGARMAQTVMPKVGGDGEVGLWCWWGGREGVEVASTIAARVWSGYPSQKNQGVKFYGTVIIPSELMNRKQVAHKGWNN